MDGDERPVPDAISGEVKSDPDDVPDAAGDEDPELSSDESEHIVVTRPEEKRDPEADAEFDRELAKLMAESVVP